jgi:hypothetical protein
MADTSRARFAPLPDTTSETERDVLAAVIRSVLGRHAKKEGGPAITAPDDAGRRSSDGAPATVRERS